MLAPLVDTGFNAAMEIDRIELDSIGIHIGVHLPEQRTYRSVTEDVVSTLTTSNGKEVTEIEQITSAQPLINPDTLTYTVNSHSFAAKRRPRLLGAIHYYNQRRSNS